MFANPEFVAWANENVVFLVGYKGKNHKVDPPAEGGDKDKGSDKEKAEPVKAGCVLYPGISCDEHEKIIADAMAGKGGPKLEVKGFPTSYMIAPDGSFERHQKDRSVKELEDGVADWTKKKNLKPTKKYQGYLASLDEGDKAASDGKWKAAVAAYLKVDAVGKKMPSLSARLAPRLDALDEKVVEAFSKARDDAATDLAAKFAAIKALRAEVAPKFACGPLPVLADIDAWLKANPPPAPAK